MTPAPGLLPSMASFAVGIEWQVSKKTALRAVGNHPAPEVRPSPRGRPRHLHGIDELLLGVEAALLRDVPHMGACGVVGDVQLLLDVGTVAPLVQEEEHLSLARGQAVPCVHVRDCDRRDACGTGCNVPCWRCKAQRCNSACPDFEASMCPRHSKPPFCCNTCAARLVINSHYELIDAARNVAS